MKANVKIHQYTNKGVYTTQKVGKGKNPKKVRVSTEVQKLIVVSHNFETKGEAKINPVKLADSLSGHLARRIKAHISGVKTGWRPGKDSYITVELEGKEVFNLETLKKRSIVQSLIRLNSVAYRKDKASELARIKNVILFTIEDSKKGFSDLEGIFE